MVLTKMRGNRNLGKLLPLYGPLSAYALAMIAFFVLNVQFGPFRIFRYVLIICAVFVGFVFYEILGWVRSTRHKMCLSRLWLSLTALILVLILINGLMMTYYSRYTYTPSGQATLTEINGMRWFFNNKDIHTVSMSNTLAPWRYAEMLLRPEEIRTRSDISRAENTLLPWHFNYDKQTMLGESYTDDIYMILNKNDRLQYVEVYPEVAEFRFLPGDFEKLEDDPSVDKLYENGGLDVWYVHPVVVSP